MSAQAACLRLHVLTRSIREGVVPISPSPLASDGPHDPNQRPPRVPSARTGPSCPRTIKKSISTANHTPSYGRERDLYKLGAPGEGPKYSNRSSRSRIPTNGILCIRDRSQRVEGGRLAPEPHRYRPITPTYAAQLPRADADERCCEAVHSV